MRIVDVGSGSPLVLVPGIQGRWEWMKPAVEALAQHCRVLTFSLADEPGWAPFEAGHGFDCYVQQVGDALRSRQLRSAAICGVSYGGLIAAAFAARHPDQVNGLVLASAVPPSWKPDGRVRFYLRAPRLLAPLFCVGSLRLYPEIAAASTGVLQGVAAALRHGARAATHPFSPLRMARRVRLVEDLDLERELPSLRAPVLIITGEDRLERVVPVSLTREYLDLWPHAQVATLHGTGHLGLITKPQDFAQAVVPFIDAARRAEPRRRIG